MDKIKKAGKFLCSMKCAIVLLMLLAVACTAGSLIPQNEVISFYTGKYSTAVAGAILMLGLNDLFHCWWFIGLTAFLCINLLCCNVLRFSSLIRSMRSGFTLEKRLKEWDGTAAVCLGEQPDQFFRSMGFHKIQTVQQEEKTYCYASRNRIGIWGAWGCHLGMLIVILGFGLGQLFQESYTVYGVPGQTKDIGDSGYELRIDDFEVRLRDDATVEQYESQLTVLNKRDSSQFRSGKTSVNSPLSLYGMKFYQNSTGWAATLEVWKGETKQQEAVLCAGEYIEVEGVEGLEVVLSAFYPDYYEDASGKPMTLTPVLRNPAYLYTIYYNGHVLGMNVLKQDEKITVEDYTFIFRDPQQYTLIQVKKDPFTGIAAVGGIMVLISLVLAFYMRPEELWAVCREDGSWDIAGKSRKGGMMFQEELVRKGRLYQQKMGGNNNGQQSVS